MREHSCLGALEHIGTQLTGLIQRKTLTGVYFCRQNHLDLVSPECPRYIGAKKADTLAWEKICEAVDKPEYLLGQARNLVEELRTSSANLQEEQARLDENREIHVKFRTDFCPV